MDVTTIQRHLAEIAAIYQRITSIVPPERWPEVSELPDAQRTVVGELSFSLGRRIDAVKDMIDQRMLSEEMTISASSQARIFFSDVLPKREEISSLWLDSIGLGSLSLDDLDLDMFITAPDSISQQKIVERPLCWYVDNISDLVQWCVERVDDYLEDGGTNPDIFVNNRIHKQTLTLIRHAQFFQPDKWYERLERIAPIVVPPKRLPRPVLQRLRELRTCIIVGNSAASTILARSILEYVLLDRAQEYSIRNTELGGDTKSLGVLVNEFSERLPDLEVAFRSIKKNGDRAVHANVGQKNVVSIYSCGIAEAYQSWAGLREVLQWLYA